MTPTYISTCNQTKDKVGFKMKLKCVFRKCCHHWAQGGGPGLQWGLRRQRGLRVRFKETFWCSLEKDRQVLQQGRSMGDDNSEWERDGKAQINCTKAKTNCTKAKINCTKAKTNCTKAKTNCTKAKTNEKLNIVELLRVLTSYSTPMCFENSRANKVVCLWSWSA